MKILWEKMKFYGKKKDCKEMYECTFGSVGREKKWKDRSI